MKGRVILFAGDTSNISHANLLKKEIKEIKRQLSKNRKKIYEMMSDFENIDKLKSIAKDVDGTYGIPNFSENKGGYKAIFDTYEKNYKELLEIYKGLGPMATISQLKAATKSGEIAKKRWESGNLSSGQWWFTDEGILKRCELSLKKLREKYKNRKR